ncbi:methyltransferase domain-containing protein [Candidatus Woesearchaeota archaeon]|nr:methyltransferase domain-containing protein [Candidatus Woesearchaeota archaeon]
MSNEANKKFFDAWAKRYDHTPVLSHWLRKLQKETMKRLELNPETSVLDVACGTGTLLAVLAQHITTGKIAGIDISPEMIQEASKKTKALPNVEVRQADVEKIPYPDATFDAVVSTEAFHHFPHALEGLKEMTRVLKHGGHIVICDVSVPPHALTNFLFKVEPGFVKLYSRKDFIELAEKAGLRVVHQKRVGLFTLMHEMRKA